MKTILVPFDFSQYAEAALDFAVQLRRQSAGTIKLVHVVEYPLGNTFNVTGEIPSYDPMDKIFTLKLIDQAKVKLKIAVDQYPEDQEFISTITMMGYPFDGIMEQIKELNADIIVMGTKGASGLKEMFVGSNAEKVVRYAKCPVITIHQKRKLEEIKDIVFATDLTVNKNSVLVAFQAYQTLFNAEIHLIWVNTPYNDLNDDMAKEQLERIAKTYKLKNYTTKISRGYDPEEAILAYAWQIDANMIAMNTHSHKGLMHLFLGSIAEDVVNHASIPVWTLTTEK